MAEMLREHAARYPPPLHPPLKFYLAADSAEAGADVDARDEDGSTALHYAGMCGNKEAFEALIAVEADPDARDNEDERPVLEA